MILITGANGFVGQKLMKFFKDAIPAPSLRNATYNDIQRIVEESGADTIIHTAAISDIGVCEENPKASYLANVEIPMYLARASKERKLICFSSDQVYSGCEEIGPYLEEKAKPANTYAKHKLEMEQRVLDIQPSAVMLRAEWMYDMDAKKGNYFTNLLYEEKSIPAGTLEYRGVTYIKEVAENMPKVIKLPGGVYNFGSETNQSIYEITRGFLKALNKDIILNDVPAGHNLWMNCQKAKKYGVEFSDVSMGLIRCAKDYGIIK